MADHPDRRPASSADLVQALSYGLRFTTSGKPHRLASDLTVRWAAEMLVWHLERSGFVVMQKLPARDGAALVRPSPDAAT